MNCHPMRDSRLTLAAHIEDEHLELSALSLSFPRLERLLLVH